MSFKNAQIVAIAADPVKYHEQKFERGDPNLIVSSSMLREFGHCPSRWRAGYVSPDSDAKDYGSLLDCRALTPEQFEKRYSIQPEKYKSPGMECPQCHSVTDSKKCSACKCERMPVIVEKDWSNASLTCKEWNEREKAAGREIASQKEVTDCDLAIKRMMEDETIKNFHESSDKQVWLSAEWHDEPTKLAVPVKCLIDYVPKIDSEFADNLGDLKSCRTGAVLPWQRDCFKRGYYLQGGMYRAIYQEATKESRTTFCFIIQENYPPYQTGLRMLSQEFAAEGQRSCERLLSRYCKCLKTDKWANYDVGPNTSQGWTVVEMEPHMQFESLSQQMEDNQAELLGESMPEECDVIP